MDTKVRVDPTLHRLLRLWAAHTNRTVQAVVDEVIRKWADGNIPGTLEVHVPPEKKES